MDYDDILVPLATLIAPILSTLLIKRFRDPRYALHWVVLPPKSMMDIAEEISERLSTTFDGKEVTNLTKFAFIVHNVGSEPIDSQMVVDPITWKAPGAILNARIVASMPPVKLGMVLSERDMVLSWDLFNQRCRALIEVICESEPAVTGASVGDIQYQIKKVPEIKIKRVVHLDEMDVRKNVRRTSAHVPRILKFLVAENFSVFVLRHRARVAALYLSSLLGLAGYIGASLHSHSHSHSELWASSIGAALFVSISVSSLIFLRNSYASILRSSPVK